MQRTPPPICAQSLLEICSSPSRATPVSGGVADVCVGTLSHLSIPMLERAVTMLCGVGGRQRIEHQSAAAFPLAFLVEKRLTDPRGVPTTCCTATPGAPGCSMFFFRIGQFGLSPARVSAPFGECWRSRFPSSIHHLAMNPRQLGHITRSVPSTVIGSPSWEAQHWHWCERRFTEPVGAANVASLVGCSGGFTSARASDSSFILFLSASHFAGLTVLRYSPSLVLIPCFVARTAALSTSSAARLLISRRA